MKVGVVKMMKTVVVQVGMSKPLTMKTRFQVKLYFNGLPLRVTNLCLPILVTVETSLTQMQQEQKKVTLLQTVVTQMHCD